MINQEWWVILEKSFKEGEDSYQFTLLAYCDWLEESGKQGYANQLRNKEILLVFHSWEVGEVKLETKKIATLIRVPNELLWDFPPREPDYGPDDFTRTTEHRRS